MGAIRLLLELASGAEGTAAKILYLVRDFASENDPDKCVPHLFTKGTSCLAETDVIFSGKWILAALKKAFESVIYYEEYQKLSSNCKEEVRKLIARKLYNESTAYDTEYNETYITDSPYDNIDSKVGKGLQCSFKIVSDYIGDRTEILSVHYPRGLFLKQKKLTECMVQALGENYFNLLTAAGQEIHLRIFEERLNKKIADDFRGYGKMVHRSIAYPLLFQEGVAGIRNMIADYLCPIEDGEWENVDTSLNTTTIDTRLGTPRLT